MCIDRLVWIRVCAAAFVVAAAGARADTIAERFPVPAGFTHKQAAPGSFGASLQALPLAPPGTAVVSFAGAPVRAPWAKAVVDIDVGTKDLQQCADSAMRLYAEHRFRSDAAAGLVFHATSGDPLPWSRYAAGERPHVVKNRIAWAKKAAPSSTHETFRRCLDDVFMWAGSLSLAKDTVPAEALAPGTLLVVGGSPGHVLVVVDVARDARGHEQVLLVQGFMPAQSIHVLGWVDVDADGSVVVDSWPAPFLQSSRRVFATR